MRDIKFRGKSIVTGNWVYGLPHYGSGGSISKIAGWMGESDNPIYDEHEVIPETVCQYTGRKDKNKIDVYQLDVISFQYIQRYEQRSFPEYIDFIENEARETQGYIYWNEDELQWYVKPLGLFPLSTGNSHKTFLHEMPLAYAGLTQVEFDELNKEHEDDFILDESVLHFKIIGNILESPWQLNEEIKTE